MNLIIGCGILALVFGGICVFVVCFPRVLLFVARFRRGVIASAVLALVIIVVFMTALAEHLIEIG